MQISISKWGNSLALRLPSHVLRSTRLEEGATVDVEVKNGKIVLTPTRKKFKLSDLLEGEAEIRRGEHDWGKQSGEENW